MYIEDIADKDAIINKGKIVYQTPRKNDVTKETYQSLEEIFIDLTTEKEEQG